MHVSFFMCRSLRELPRWIVTVLGGNATSRTITNHACRSLDNICRDRSSTISHIHRPSATKLAAFPPRWLHRHSSFQCAIPVDFCLFLELWFVRQTGIHTLSSLRAGVSIECGVHQTAA